jgi:hypothetical protein
MVMYRGDSLRSLAGVDDHIDVSPSAKKKRPLIFYFSVPGRAEAIRLAAVIGHVSVVELYHLGLQSRCPI